MPIHGEHHMIVTHADLAKGMGVPEANIFTLDNGQILEINSAQEAKDCGRPKGHYRLCVYRRAGRRRCGRSGYPRPPGYGQDGMFVIIMTLDRRTGKLVNQPDIISRGFIYMKDNDDLIREVKHEVRKLCESKGKEKLEPNYAYLRNVVRDEIGEYLYQKTERRPMVLPVVIEV